VEPDEEIFEKPKYPAAIIATAITIDHILWTLMKDFVL
jgi:hypothetical protein